MTAKKIWKKGLDDLDRVIEQMQEHLAKIDPTTKVWRLDCPVCHLAFAGIERKGVKTLASDSNRCPFCNALAKHIDWWEEEKRLAIEENQYRLTL